MKERKKRRMEVGRSRIEGRGKKEDKDERGLKGMGEREEASEERERIEGERR